MQKNKILIATVLAVALAGGAFAASKYGDKQITAFYDGSSIKDKRLQINGKADMGLTEGTAQWTAHITPDLCSPEQQLQLRGEDTISRGLTGYTIVSKIYLQSKNSGEEFFLMDGESQWNWSGKGQMKYRIPAGQHNLPREQGTLSWSEITASADISKGKTGDFEPTNVVFKLPELQFKDGKNTALHLQNGFFESEGGLYPNVQNTAAKMGLEKLSLQLDWRGENVVFEMNGAHQNNQQMLEIDKINTLSKSTIERIRFQNHTLDNVKLNTTVKGMNMMALQKWVAFNQKQGQTCIAQNEMEQEIKDLVLVLLNNGLTIESEGNEATLNQGKATLNMSATLAAGNYSQPEDVMRQLSEKLQYRLNATVDKSVLADLGLLQQGDQILSDADLDMILTQLPPPFHAVRVGDKIEISVKQP